MTNSAPPTAVLSDHFEQRIGGRKVVAAVFMTFQFDPGFFEQEVLPVLLDVSLSHAKKVRIVQLAEALRGVRERVAVYYSADGLVTSDAGAPRLDIERIPIRVATGYFHPKNVFLLVEAPPSEEGAPREQALLVACLSANLTRSGWWENVEACHVEELQQGERTRLRDDLLTYLEAVRSRARVESDQRALLAIRKFVRDTEQAAHRSQEDALRPHFYFGRDPLADFLENTAGGYLRGSCLEILSPYFDDASHSTPLRTLVERFQPKQVLVYLPRSASGEAQCGKALYDDVRTLPNTGWGRLPKDSVRAGASKEVADRFVHAKVYRFFTQSPKREIYLVSSANLTNAAHGAGGNVETGFLVEVIPERRPDFWLIPDERKPLDFAAKTEGEDCAGSRGTHLNLCYHWDTRIARVFWDAASTSPTLRLEARGVEIGTIDPLPPRSWVDLDERIANVVRDMLNETAFLTVHGDGDATGLLLVQEEGFAKKPSPLLELSAAEILRYWALLTPAQRSDFIERHALSLLAGDDDERLLPFVKPIRTHDSFFDRFAGFFHAFGCHERAVRTALAEGNARDAGYRLFGTQYDSLLHLLDLVIADTCALDIVERYVIILCARQLGRELTRDFPEFWEQHRDDARDFESRITAAQAIRDSLSATTPDAMPAFLDWLDRRFLSRARRAEAEPA